MKIRVHEPHGLHPDRRGQVGIERAAPTVGGMRLVGGHIGVGDLTMRMYPGVRAAGAMHRDAAALAKHGERCFEPILDRVPMRLTLPPLEWLPIVGDHQPQPPTRLVHGRQSIGETGAPCRIASPSR